MKSSLGFIFKKKEELKVVKVVSIWKNYVIEWIVVSSLVECIDLGSILDYSFLMTEYSINNISSVGFLTSSGRK